MPFDMTIRWLPQPESARTRTVWLNAGDPASRHTEAMRVLPARRRFIVESQALVRRLHCESCERSVLSPYLQQRNLVIDQDETVRDLNGATRELAAESCSHRHGGLVLDSVQRLHCILVLGLRVFLPGLYRVQTPNCATLIVHHRVCGKAIR